MGGWRAIGLLVGIVVFAAGLVVVAARARPRASGRRVTASRHDGPPLTRRELLDQGLVALVVGGLAGMVASVTDFLWPSITGRGGRYRAGPAAALRAGFRASRRPYYHPVGNFYLVPYPPGDLPAARRVYAEALVPGMAGGWVALSARCPHAGCRVPWCDSSQWFECPCHGSRFNRAGEQRRGPATRGMDRYPVTISGGEVVVDTTEVFRGPPPGTDTTGDGPAGPHCT